MVLPRKGVPRLLKLVQGEPHAGPEDHADYRPLSPPASNPSNKPGANDEDYDREPESSSDEAVVPPKQTVVDGCKNRTDLGPLQLDGTKDQPASHSNAPMNEKRRIAEATKDDDDDDAIFAETDLRAKRRKMDGPGVRNIHAQAQSKHDRTTAYLKQAGYGSRSRQQAPSQKKALTHSKVVKATKSSSPKPKFRTPKEISAAKGPVEPRPHFRSTRASSAANSVQTPEIDCASSSSLSSVPDSRDDEELRASRPQSPPKRSIEVECAICGSGVSRALREDFEDTHNKSERLNYKWQQRFCRHHKQHESRDVWRQRGYPDIDWASLGARLKTRAYTKHLKKVLAGETASIYRDRLTERLESGVMSVQQSVAGEGKTGANVGYYGPRGEKLLTEHIVARFAEEIRDRSIHDPLVAAAGVQGGVSGFVQAVLVPELAICLIDDDLGSKTDQSAAEVIAESSDLGELLNPEVEDQLHETMDQSGDEEE